MKKLFKVLVIVLLAVCTVNLTACDGNEKASSARFPRSALYQYGKGYEKALGAARGNKPYGVQFFSQARFYRIQQNLPRLPARKACNQALPRARVRVDGERTGRGGQGSFPRRMPHLRAFG